MYQHQDSVITLNEAASILDVSSATVRNWVKHQYIKPVQNSKLFLFNSKEIKKLKSNIYKGNINRLRNRANKIGAKRKFIPDEYLINRSDKVLINSIISYISLNKININQSLFLLSLKLIKKQNLLKQIRINNYLILNAEEFNNKQLFHEMKNWYDSLNNFIIDKKINRFLEFNVPDQKDILGLIYQSLMCEGDKSNRGSYYTPNKIVKDIVNETDKTEIKILDPCCGTGQFLLTFSEKIKKPENLYGFDIDKTAVRIARINIILNFKNVYFSPNIYHIDTLNININCNPGNLKFDIIATNPPWGMKFSKNDKISLEKLYPEISSYESFSYILKKSIDLLKKNGKLFFILPESILNVKIHNDIRNYILKNTKIEKILFLNRVFKNVFTPVIRIDLIKNNNNFNNNIYIYKNNRINKIKQSSFLKNHNKIFNINISNKDQDILNKIYSSNCTTLKDNAAWTLGIVTGNNKKYITTEKKDGYEEIITGKELEKFYIKSSKKFIKFDPEKFQQCAPEYKYRTKEKLIYKFISNKLIFAYDNKQRLTLNSANILIPKVNNYPLKVILALFNSSIYQYIFQKKFSTIKVLKSHLEQLPLPLWDNLTFDMISCLVDKINNINDENFRLMDHIIMENFSISRKEMKIILENQK